MADCRVVTTCKCPHFLTTYLLLLTTTPTLNMEEEFSFETFVNNYQTTVCRISEDSAFRDGNSWRGGWWGVVLLCFVEGTQIA